MGARQAYLAAISLLVPLEVIVLQELCPVLIAQWEGHQHRVSGCLSVTEWFHLHTVAAVASQAGLLPVVWAVALGDFHEVGFQLDRCRTVAVIAWQEGCPRWQLAGCSHVQEDSSELMPLKQHHSHTVAAEAWQVVRMRQHSGVAVSLSLLDFLQPAAWMLQHSETEAAWLQEWIHQQIALALTRSGSTELLGVEVGRHQWVVAQAKVCSEGHHPHLAAVVGLGPAVLPSKQHLEEPAVPLVSEKALMGGVREVLSVIA